MSMLVGRIGVTENAARNLYGRLNDFAFERYGVREEDVAEEHVIAFIEHLPEQAPVLVDGWRRQMPMQRTLGIQFGALARHLRENGIHCPVTHRAINYAEELAERYAPEPIQAPAMSDDIFRETIDGCSTETAGGKRDRAAFLVVRGTWARPSEILRRMYPAEVRAEFREGIVIVVPSSKINQRGEPEYLPIAHAPSERHCAVCALRDWLDYLGPDYKGPLFPRLDVNRRRPMASAMSTADFNVQLRKAVNRVGLGAIHYSSYSLRRGPATAAALRGEPLSKISEALRHENYLQALTYIEAPAMFEMMKNVLA